MNKRFVRAILVGVTGMMAIGPAVATHSWNGYHWAGPGRELALKVNTSITAQWDLSVGKAIGDWTSSTELDLTRVPSAVNRKKCSPIAGQILVCNDAYGQRGWLGIASIWLSNGHIVQGTTKLNDSYHNFAPYNRPEWRALVACQEVGHDFGLDHQDETFDNANLGTCMDYTNNPLGPPANTSPNAHDYAELSDIYNHDDGYTSATASINSSVGQPSIAAGAEGIGDSPAEWGRPVHADRYGRPDVFQKELGGGNRVLTHVLWAIGEGPRGR